MRRMCAGLTAAAFIVALGAPAFAKAATIKGVLVDQTCFLKDKGSDKEHKTAKEEAACALACAKNGAPLALLTADGKVYAITGDLAANKNAKLVAHVSHTVEITGDVTEKDGKMMIAGTSVKTVK